MMRFATQPTPPVPAPAPPPLKPTGPVTRVLQKALSVPVKR